MPVDQHHLNNYFSTVWARRELSLDRMQHTGWSLIDKIHPGEKVIDVGCGRNPFRGKISNLIGVDPAFSEADHQMTLEQFVTDYPALRFNVAFCLGSINFGTQADIEHQIGLLVRVLRTKNSRIYWRCNPGQADHGNPECEHIPFYAWSESEHVRLAEQFGFRIGEMAWDHNRIYAEWISLNRAVDSETA
jgi:hypothetical protein